MLKEEEVYKKLQIYPRLEIKDKDIKDAEQGRKQVFIVSRQLL